jgi:hypothetical protein
MTIDLALAPAPLQKSNVLHTADNCFENPESINYNPNLVEHVDGAYMDCIEKAPHKLIRFSFRFKPNRNIPRSPNQRINGF